MDIKFMFFCSIVLTLFFIKLNTAQKLGEYLVRRTQTYDEIKFDDDCNILDAASTVRSGKKWCHCEKFHEVNNVKTVLYGNLFVYENLERQARIKCVYDYRETGANFFISPSYSAEFATFTVRDKDVTRYLTKGADIFAATQYPIETSLFVDALLVYDNQKQTYVKHNYDDIFRVKRRFILKSDRVHYDRVKTNYGFTLIADRAIIDDLAGSMPHIILNESVGGFSNPDENLNGFTVVKFIGERTYKIYIGTEPTYSLTSAKSISNNEDNKTNGIITYSLVGIDCVLILVMVLLIWKLRGKSRNNKSSQEKGDYHQEKQDNINDGLKKYEQLSIALMKADYQEIPEDFHLNSRPQNHLLSQTKVENRKSAQNEYGYEITYGNAERNSCIYADAF